MTPEMAELSALMHAFIHDQDDLGREIIARIVEDRDAAADALEFVCSMLTREDLDRNRAVLALMHAQEIIDNAAATTIDNEEGEPNGSGS